jgi:hypothetical protein
MPPVTRETVLGDSQRMTTLRSARFTPVVPGAGRPLDLGLLAVGSRGSSQRRACSCGGV